MGPEHWPVGWKTDWDTEGMIGAEGSVVNDVAAHGNVAVEAVLVGGVGSSPATAGKATHPVERRTSVGGSEVEVVVDSDEAVDLSWCGVSSLVGTDLDGHAAGEVG